MRAARKSIAVGLLLVLAVLAGATGTLGTSVPIPVAQSLVLHGTLTVDTLRTYRAPYQGLMSSATTEHLVVTMVLGHTTVQETWDTTERMVPYTQNDCDIDGISAASVGGSILSPAAVWFIAGGWPSPIDVFRGATYGLPSLTADGTSAASLVGLDGTCQYMVNELRLTVPYGGLATADEFLGNGVPIGSHVVTVGSGDERVRSLWTWFFQYGPVPCLSLVISDSNCWDSLDVDVEPVSSSNGERVYYN